MERKKFITSAFGAGAIIAAAAAALGATPSPNANENPGASGNPCLPSHAGFGGGPRPTGSPNPTALLEHADRNLGRLIETLQRDPNDYAGHKTQAIGYLQQALTQVQAALQFAGGGAQSPIQSSP
jgi:hypothetical protein